MNRLHQNVWNNCLSAIRESIPIASYRTWFEPIVPLKLEKNVLTIQVPSTFFYEYIEDKYIEILSRSLRHELGEDAKLEYRLPAKAAGIKSNSTVDFTTPSTFSQTSASTKQPTPVEKHAKLNPFVIPGAKTKVQINPQLNPRYTMDAFIVGDCNRLAQSAGMEISQNPGGTAYNPFVVHGESGLGKTHLAQAIGFEIKNRFPEKAVLYVTANRFQTQYTEAVRNNNVNNFIHFYQNIDVLIIDDIHEFKGKDKTQQSFFHIFNHLHQLNKQLILTSDTHPANLDGMEKRLLSRFKWGLITELAMPDHETRLAILKAKMKKDAVNFPIDVLEMIAANVSGSIRELESAIVTLSAPFKLMKRQITVESAREAIDKMIKSTKRELSIDSIQKIICDYFNMTPELLHTKSRKREIVQVRQICMYFAKAMTKLSLSTIGASLGGKDHATVLHANKTVINLMETDKKYRSQIGELEKKLKG